MIASRTLTAFAATVAAAVNLAGAGAATLNVPTTGYPTIQSAIDAAQPGDTILVAAGTYAEALTWVGKDLTILGAGAGRTVVDLNYSGRCLYTSNLTNAARIAGFTFTRGRADLGAGMLNTGAYTFFHYYPLFNQSSPTVVGCAFIGNRAEYDPGDHSLVGGYGGAFYNQFGSSPVLVNCLIANNYAGVGGGMHNSDSSNPALINCTIVANSAETGGAMNVQIDSHPSLSNCILWGNTATYGPSIFDLSGTIATYSDVQGGWAGTGNIAVDPLFVNAGSGDFRLQTGSPCIDAGLNSAVPAGTTTDIAGLTRIDNGVVDMGANEYSPAASTVQLESAVTSLATSGAVLPADGNSLLAKLNAAISALNAGDIATATTKLQDFINQVRALVRTGRLTASEGQALIDAANAILAEL